MDVIGTLQGADHGDSLLSAPCSLLPPRVCDGSLRLDIELLLKPYPKRPFDNEIRRLLSRRHVALGDLDRAVDLGCLGDLEDRGMRLVRDGDMAGCLLEERPV